MIGPGRLARYAGAAAAAAIAAIAAAGCTGTVGTVQIELTTAPGSPLIDSVETLRLTLSSPRRVIEAQRTAAGFDLALDLPASDTSGALIVEGFDAAGALVACGQSPVFPLSAINARIVIYLAPPRSIAVAPAALTAPRSELAGAALDYGLVVAGGRDASGAPASTIAIYNAYDHSLVEGIPLPAPRTGLAIASGAGGRVYLFGGTGADGKPAGTLWRFETTVAPSGAYSTVTDEAGLARAGQQIVATGPEQFLITGSPALTLRAGALAVRSDIAALPPTGAAVTSPDGTRVAIFAGPELVRFRGDAFDTLAGAGRPDATAAALPDGRVVVIGGGAPLSRDALVIDAATGAITVIPGALAIPRARPSVAATSRHLVVAGGTGADGAPIASAEVLEVDSLAPIVTLPILPRTGGFAVALPTGQVILGGGAPAARELELFTPEPPP